MADGDIALEVLIKSVLDATGYRMNEQEALKLKAAVGQTATAAVAANAADSAGTEALILKKRELMHVVNALGGQAVPELGRALSTLYVGGGTAAGIFLLVGAFELVRKFISQASDKAKELAATSADIWMSARDASNEALKSAQDFAEAMKKATDESGDLKKALAGSQTVLAAMVDLHKKVLDAVEKEQLAEAAGDKTKEEAIKRRFEDIKGEYDLVAESLKMEQLRADIFQRSFALHMKFREQAEAAEKALEAENRNQAAADAAGRNAGKDEKSLKANLDAKQAELDRFRSGDRTATEILAGKSEHDLLEELAAVQKAFSAYEADAEIVRQHTVATDALTKKKDAAVKQVTENNDAIKDETEQLKTGERVLDVHRESQRRQAAFNAVEQAGGPSAALAGGIGALDAIEHGQRLDAKGVQAYQAFRAVFDSVHGQFDQILAIDERNAALHQSHAQRLAQLEVMFHNLQTQATRPRQ
jgi:hypothetical protein